MKTSAITRVLTKVNIILLLLLFYFFTLVKICTDRQYSLVTVPNTTIYLVLNSYDYKNEY